VTDHESTEWFILSSLKSFSLTSVPGLR
jgi:hypothetical protein